MKIRGLSELWICAACVVALMSSFSMQAHAERLRILLRVNTPEGAVIREGDERPADAALDFPALLREFGEGLIPDLTTLTVQRIDAGTLQPIPYGRYAHATTEFDIPWRWYDNIIAYDFPENDANLDQNNGNLTFNTIPRFGYFYNCIGDGREGHLAFVHRETDARPATYAVLFDVLPRDAKPNAVPPRGFLGDGLQRCAPDASSTTGLIHSRVDVADWNGDGLFDLVVGCARGGVVWYPNLGELGTPRFPVSYLVHTSDGVPLDIGWSATPHAVDWDNDGDLDLLAGGEWNRVMLFRNTKNGPGEPVLESNGLLRLDNGEPFHVPWEPCPETQPHMTYTRDYYSVLETADWDNDGDLDLLAGGYVTGRVFLFTNVADKGQEPRLQLVGPLEADGAPLDVAWCAAPSVADLDNDGDLDLVSGSMPMTAGGGDSASSERFLNYFRNDGTRSEPKLHAVELPHTGTFPAIALSTPRFIDWSNDGVIDLVVSAGENIYLYRNAGSPTEPSFEAHCNALPSQWGTATLPFNQFLDWNGDGWVDGINAPYVSLNSGKGNPGVFAPPSSLVQEGQTISHLSGIGDDWRYQRLYDLDGDGRIDLMDADHAGHFWWHANRGTQDKPEFATEGVMLLLADGNPISVGAGREGFDSLQGARATYAAGDVDKDGLPDLVTANFAGAVRYFRQAPRAEGANTPVFAFGIDIGKMATFAALSVADWNGDGVLDVIAASSAADASVMLGRAGDPQTPFEPAQRLSLPNAPYGAGEPVVVADYNADGDADIILYTPYRYMCFYEHSFIQLGYAPAEVIKVERIEAAQ